MSGAYENQRTLRQLRAKIDELKPSKGEKFYFINSYPRSDMCKGTLIAQLLNVVPNSDAMKFDGLLNTDDYGVHARSDIDDFAIYTQFNPGKKWSTNHYLIGGDLWRDFLNEFGDAKNHLQINPHLSIYLEYRILKIWDQIGRPEHFFIEMGGTLLDSEVNPVFAPLLQRLCEERPNDTRIIVLSELAYNGEHIKTKTVQDSVKMLRSQQLTPWLVVARDVKEIKNVDFDERLEFERIISNKIFDSTGLRLLRVISVPFYDNLIEYTKYIQERFLPLIGNYEKDEVIIATGNTSKFDDFRIYISDEYQIRMLKASEKNNIPEGVVSIADNAIAKARAYAIKLNKVAIGDDTGFFIKELYGEPGVALRRWGGELPEEISQEKFWKFLQKKTANLSNYDSYFDQCIAVVAPNGEYKIIHNKTEGYLNKEKLRLPYNGSAYPIGVAFEAKERAKTWDEMSDDEKREFDSWIVDELKKFLKSVLPNE
jgi:non-canonical purine NTP pyrophosphatase (RdgB/HAM1 family)